MDIAPTPIAPDDAEICAALHRASFDNAAWSLEQITGSLALATTTGFVLRHNDVPVGFILCQQTPDETEILTLATHPAWQRRGFGERLLQAAIEAARAAGSAGMFLDVATDNAAAIGLYEKRGFRQIGKRPCYYPRAGGVVAALLYRLALA